MRIYFQDWIYTQSFSRHSLDLFEESILCYRSEAYKGALLFTFLGFQNIIRERVLNASLPSNAIGFESKWGEIQDRLRNEDQSDAEVIKCITMQKPFDIFSISDDLRNQYIYWKNRRNDCAHGKNNKIECSHVENFWLFIESNIINFNVNGSILYLLDEINKHFDISRTPVDTQPDYLIKKIPNSIKSHELLDFLTKINQEIINKKTMPYEHLNVLIFYENLFTLENEFLDVVRDFFKQDRKLLLKLLLREPSRIYHFKNDPEMIRQLWKKEFRNNVSFYEIVVKMLQFDLIPKEQISEFVSDTSSNIGDSYFSNFPQEREQELKIMKEKGFIKELGEIAFDSSFPKINSFNWARENKYLICHYLQEYNFNEDAVRAIYIAFKGEHYPWQFGKELKKLLSSNPALYKQYEMIAETYRVEIPEHFLQ